MRTVDRYKLYNTVLAISIMIKWHAVFDIFLFLDQRVYNN